MKNIISTFIKWNILLFAFLLVGIDCLHAKEGTQKWVFETEGSVISSPTIGPDHTIYVGSNDGYLYALTPDGKLKWRFPAQGAVHSHPAIGPDGTIYIGSWDQSLYAINPNGTLKWLFRTKGVINSSPIVGPDNTIYFGSRDHYFYAVHPNGDLKWKLETRGELFSTPTMGPDGTLYIGGWDHFIYAIHGSKSKTPQVKETSLKIGSNETKLKKTTKQMQPEDVKIKTPNKKKKNIYSTEIEDGVGSIESIQVEETPEGGEKVVFHLRNLDPPRFYIYDGDKPRPVCDFINAHLAKGIGHRIRVDGNFIQQIRLARYKEPRVKVRVVLDLVLDKEHKVSKAFDENKNFFTIRVTPNNGS